MNTEKLLNAARVSGVTVVMGVLIAMAAERDWHPTSNHLSGKRVMPHDFLLAGGPPPPVKATKPKPAQPVEVKIPAKRVVKRAA